jgi:tetratricopeptide (TPR) repeat protein
VAGVRPALPDAEILTTAAGYQLVVAPGSLDASVFESLYADGRAALADGRFAEAAQILGEALDLWHGEVLDGIDLPAALHAPVTRLAELRLLALEARFEARLASGEDSGLVPELVGLTEAYPLRETLRGQLMLALHRAGRTPEALAAYRAFRDRLVEEVGVEPSDAVQQLHHQILSGSVEKPAAPPNQLPADVGGFVGRDDQLRALDAAAAAKAPVVVISGMAGAGKTALAIRWAHRTAAAFPDGVIYLNLRGYSTDDPLSPLAAVTLVLRALGVAAASVPVDVDEAVGMYRTHLAQRRVLLVLDNAREADQVRPLLPGGAACMTLVTSRDRLTGLVVRDNARPVPIEPLSDEESLALLRSILGAGSPARLAELARACAGLPLALRIAGAKYAERPGYEGDLAEEDRLGWLKVSGDAQASVRAAFEASYRLLADAERRLFRLLGLIPGATFTPAVAAALAGDDASTRDGLRALAAAHLVEQHEHGYALHDLLRRYAREEVAPGEAGPAIERLCAHYEGMVEAAAQLLYDTMLRLPDARPVRPNPLADAVAAREWLDAELPNLVALIHEAAVSGPMPSAWRLADGLRGYFWIRRPVAEWLATAGDGLAAAAAEGDDQAVAAMHMSFGLAWRTIGQHGQAEEHLHAAKAAAARAGWREAHASALGHLAVSHAERGDNSAALDLLGQALELNRKMGRRPGEAVVLTNMGTLQYHLGALATSAEYTLEALAAYREVGNVGGEGLALSNLGIAYVYMGQREQAWAYLTEGQRIFDRIGDRIGLAEGGYGFAKLHSEAGDYEDAEKHAAAAIELAEGAGDGALAGICQAELSHIRYALGRSSDVVGQCTAARASAKSSNNVYAEVWTVILLARAYAVTGRLDEAHETATEAVGMAARWGYRLLEGEAHRVLGEILHDRGERDAAVRSAEAAIECLDDCGYRLGVERARSLLVRATA